MRSFVLSWLCVSASFVLAAALQHPVASPHRYPARVPQLPDPGPAPDPTSDPSPNPDPGTSAAADPDTSPSAIPPPPSAPLVPRTCKATPSSPGWPTPDQWASLNASVDGRLLAATPPGAVCHEEQLTFSPTRCAAVKDAWSSQAFHADDPVSCMEGANEGACSPFVDRGDPCDADAFPAYVVNATTTRHVQQGLLFAKRYNIRLTVKAGGHDVHERSGAPHALSIWVHHMRGVTLHGAPFKLRGCPSAYNATYVDGTAATFGPGVDTQALLAALDQAGLTTVGGDGLTIGYGGYVAGGGHGLLSRTRGLAVDNVLQMEVVTPRGDARVVNECQSSDLFWALRGGGGSTFGVVTSITMRTFPTVPVVSLRRVFSTTPDSNASVLVDGLAFLGAQLPALEAAGVTGTVAVFSPGEDASPALVATFQLTNSSDPAALAALTDPVLAALLTLSPLQESTAVLSADRAPPAVYPSVWAHLLANADASAAGRAAFAGSRLLDARALGAEGATRDALASLAACPGGASLAVVAGKGVWEAQPRGGSTPLHGSWRTTALVQAATSVEYTPLDETSRNAAMAQVNDCMQGLRELAPDMGVYSSESLSFEPEWWQAFWGDNYSALLDVKRKYDPDDTLWCNPCVGNDRWEEVGYELCQVVPDPVQGDED